MRIVSDIEAIPMEISGDGNLSMQIALNVIVTEIPSNYGLIEWDGTALRVS